MPESFHHPKSFKSALSIAKDALKDPSVIKGGKVDAPLLLLGLMYREVTRALEVEPGEPGEYPPHLITSPFGRKEIDEMVRLLNGVSS